MTCVLLGSVLFSCRSCRFYRYRKKWLQGALIMDSPEEAECKWQGKNWRLINRSRAVFLFVIRSLRLFFRTVGNLQWNKKFQNLFHHIRRSNQITVFCDTSPYTGVGSCRHFGETCCIRLQGRKVRRQLKMVRLQQRQDQDRHFDGNNNDRWPLH